MTDEPKHFSHGPSGASRWLRCTDSPYASAGYPDETTDAADEGTAAHWLLEQCLNAGQDAATIAEAQGHVIPAGEETGTIKDWPITGEMIEAVQLHIDTVKPDIEKKGTRLFVEERVRLDEHMGLPVPVGGTADTILYLPRSKTLKIIDFKYGRGHVVEVEDKAWGVNPQLGIYALAALAELERLLGEKREVKWIELVVVQPRAPHKKGPVRKKKVAPLQLLKLETAVVNATLGERVRVAGDHCHFCRAKPDCETFHQDRHAKATADFGAEDLPADATPGAGPDVPAVAEPEVPALQTIGEILARPVKGLTLVELGQARQLAQHVRKWLGEVDEEVKQRLLHDLKVPGARLGQGRGKRSWAGDQRELRVAASAAALRLGLEEEAFFTEPELKSPAQLEEQLGKAKFKETSLAQLVSYVAGGPVVVDEDSDTPDWAPAEAFEAAEEPPAEPASAKHHLL